MKVEAVIFTWDGVLADSADLQYHALRGATSELLGVAYPRTRAEHALLAPMPTDELMATLAGDDSSLKEAVLHRYREIYNASRAARLRPFPRAREVLDELRSLGIAIAAVSGMTRQRMVSDIAYCRLQASIDTVVSLEDCPDRPPHPGTIQGAVQALGADASQTVFVGKSPEDMIASRAVLTYTVGASYNGIYDEHMILAREPDAVISQLSDILDVIEKIDQRARPRV